MRSTTAGELATLAKLERVVTVRVKVANGSLTMVDLSNRFHGATIDHDVDQPVSGANIAFRRDQGAIQSLSPLRTDSILNVNDVGAYSPLLDLKRAVTVEVATTNIGATVVAGDYKMLFKGTIDRVRFERSPISIECRDLGAPLVDRWVETEKFYSSVGGEPIQDVMQDILDDVFGAGVVPLYVPVDPLYNINKYFQKRMSVMGALTELMQLRGLDVRYRWDDGTSAFRLTLTEPPRSKTVPDHTFTPSKYFEITNLDIENLGIKNAIAGSFRDSTDMGNRNDPIVVTDGPSITKYDRQYFLIQEGDDSPIDTPSEMTTMLNYALADLKEPKASQGVEAPLFWPADVSDLYRYPNNRVHYNTDQDFAVRGFTHELGQKRHRTIFKVGGTVIGQYNTWLGRGGTIGGTGTAFPPVPRIIPLNTESDDATWDLQFTSTNGSGGGGSNLTYSIKSKKYFGGESTIDTGTGADLPDTEVIVRDPRDDQVITFEVTDAATGMVAAETFVVPSYLVAIQITTGKLLGSQLVATSVPTGALENLAVTTAKIADGNVTKAKTEARSRCRVYADAQTISDSTITTLAFANESFDVGTLHDNATNNSRITIQAGGDVGGWLVSAQVCFDNPSVVGDRTVHLFKNGSQVASASFPAATGVTVVPIVWVDSIPTAGDYYEVKVRQDSGGDLDVTGTSSLTWFSAIHLW